MTQTCFHDAASGLLTDEAFSFIVRHLLKHAGRTQEFLTLVVFVATRASRDAIGAADEWTRELAWLIRHAVRETDLLGRTRDGTLSLILAGVDAERAIPVIERLHQQLGRYRTSPSLQISIGAASCPTHAIEVDELLRHAISHSTASSTGGDSLIGL